MGTNLAAIRNELLPGLYTITGRYEMIEPQYKKIFSTRNSIMANEKSSAMRMLALPKLKAEGGQIAFDNAAGDRWTYNIEHISVGLGYAMTREAIDDNLYKKDFTPMNLEMNKSFLQFKEIQAASILNLATTLIPGIGGDGQPLCSTSHPVDGAVWGNRPIIDADLNEATMLQAQVAVRRNFVNEAGLRIMSRAEKLIGPPELQPVMHRLIHAELRPGTNNNEPNVIPVTGNGGGIKEYVVLDFLTSPYAWYLKTNIDGLVHMQRKPYETDMDIDFTTQNLLVTGYERYSFSYNDPRAIYGSFPVS